MANEIKQTHLVSNKVFSLDALAFLKEYFLQEKIIINIKKSIIFVYFDKQKLLSRIPGNTTKSFRLPYIIPTKYSIWTTKSKLEREEWTQQFIRWSQMAERSDFGKKTTSNGVFKLTFRAVFSSDGVPTIIATTPIYVRPIRGHSFIQKGDGRFAVTCGWISPPCN